MQKSKPPRFLVVGIDAATWPLVKRWIKSGDLPTMAGLAEKGAAGHLRSVPNINSANAWTSFATGKNAGKHGIFFFHHKVKGTYDIRYVNGSDRHGTPFWALAGEHGKRVCVLNVPMTFPAEPVNGILVSGMDCPSFSSTGAVYPEGMQRDLLQQVPDYVLEYDPVPLFASGKFDQAFEEARKATTARTEAALWLMAREQWDLFVLCYRILDPIQHHFFRHGLPSPDPDDPSAYLECSDIIREFYRLVDNQLGRILDRTDDETTVVLLSDHGMTGALRGAHFLPRVLAELGLVVPKHDPRRMVARFRTRLLTKLRSRIPKALAEGLKRFLPKTVSRVARSAYFANTDFARSPFLFEFPSSLWCNLVGREPLGVVPEQEYDAAIEKARRKLITWHDPGSGRKVVRSVPRRDEIYQGPYVDLAPDLFVLLAEDLMVRGIDFVGSAEAGSRSVSTGRLPEPGIRMEAGHADNGMFMMSGPALLGSVQPSSTKIEDIPATLLYLMEVPVPDDMDGRALMEVIDPAFSSSHAQQSVHSGDPQRAERSYSDVEEEVVEQRLRDLGYL